MSEKMQIELQGIVREFGTKVKTRVLKGIDLSFFRGEFTAIIGQSGSGKSTLLNIMSALDRPTSGEVMAEGKKITSLNDYDLAQFRNRTLGFIFQFHYLLPEFSALENVMIPYWIAFGKGPSQEQKDFAMELLERVGVGSKMYNRRTTELSGGQQQRVAIARALANRPRIILADEPTGSLDSDTSVKINDLLREINEEDNTTFIIVTHDRHIAAKCDRVIELEDGQVKRDYLTKDMEHDDRWQELAPVYCDRYEELREKCQHAKA